MRIHVRAPLALAFAAALAAFGCQPQKAADTAAPKLETDDQKTFYALGLAVAQELEAFAPTESDVEAVKQGLADGALHRTPQVTLEEWGPKISGLQKARQEVAAKGEKTASESFLAQAAAEPGAVKTESGLVYREITPGTGKTPTDKDIVKVNYHGTLRDGTVFDSSIERGQPAIFPLGRVIPCWTEAVQKMKVGGKSHITCPSDIAYGDRGAPGGKIKPGAAIAFDVELLDVMPAPEDGGMSALPPGHPAPNGMPPGHPAPSPQAKPKN